MTEAQSYISEDSSVLLDAIHAKLKKLMQKPSKVLFANSQIMINRVNENTPCSVACFYQPLIAFIIGGKKNACVGSKEFLFTKGDIFITGLDIPAYSYITDVDKDDPFFSVTIYIKPEIIAELLGNIKTNNIDFNSSTLCAQVVHSSRPELVTLLRILELYEQGERADYPYELLLREMYYYLFSSPKGSSLLRIFMSSTQDHQISKVISFLRDNYREEIDIEQLASMVAMAVPTFYKHFKQVTSLSPLQYLKRLRLYEAKRLMIVEQKSAAKAGFEVGYTSEQHFSRDYKKLFGRPPLQDIKESLSIDVNYYGSVSVPVQYSSN